MGGPLLQGNRRRGIPAPIFLYYHLTVFSFLLCVFATLRLCVRFYRNNGDHTFTDVFLTSHPMRCEKKPMPKSVMMDTDSAVALATMITMDLRTSISRILAQMSCTVTTVTGRLPTEQRHQVSVTSDGAPVPLLLIMTETAIWIYLSPTTWHINWRTTPSVIGSVPDFLVLHAGSGEKATHFLRPCLLVTASTACR